MCGNSPRMCPAVQESVAPGPHLKERRDPRPHTVALGLTDLFNAGMQGDK